MIVEPAPSLYPVKATSPAEWADDANTMLITYSPNPADVLAFIEEHGVLGGYYVESVGATYVVGENGWMLGLSDGRFGVAAGSR